MTAVLQCVSVASLCNVVSTLIGFILQFQVHFPKAPVDHGVMRLFCIESGLPAISLTSSSSADVLTCSRSCITCCLDVENDILMPYSRFHVVSCVCMSLFLLFSVL